MIMLDNEWAILKGHYNPYGWMGIHLACKNIDYLKANINKMKFAYGAGCNMNKRTMSCHMCRTRSSREIFTKFKFIAGVK